MITHENIDIACNSACMKYELLNTNILKDNKPLPNIIGETDKFLVMMDISYILSILIRINKLGDNFLDSELSNDMVDYIAYSILNAAGHYRNYISDKLYRRNVLVIYSSKPEYYKKFHNVMTKISALMTLFKKTIFIDRLNDADGKDEYLYNHVAYYTALKISNNNRKNGRKLRIIYIGNNVLASNMLNIDNEMIHIKNRYMKYGLDVFYTGKLMNIQSNGLFDDRETNLIVPLIALLGDSYSFSRLDSIKKMKSSKIYDLLCNTLNIDPSDPSTYIQNIPLSPDDEQLFNNRVRMIDPNFQGRVLDITKKALSIWTSKIKSNYVHSLNDIIEVKDITLNIHWLVV